MSKKLILLIASLFIGFMSHAQDKLLADVFEANTLANFDNSVTYTKEFKGTSSYFASFKDYPEQTVFSSEVTYTSNDADESYVLRVGKGGQIYSLTSAFGEAVPPQHDNNRTKRSTLFIKQAFM
jgi:hypothetical protein